MAPRASDLPKPLVRAQGCKGTGAENGAGIEKWPAGSEKWGSRADTAPGPGGEFVAPHLGPEEVTRPCSGEELTLLRVLRRAGIEPHEAVFRLLGGSTLT
jgi:hypothetical protein